MYYEKSKPHVAPTGAHADYVAALEKRLKGTSRLRIVEIAVVVLVVVWLGWKEIGGGGSIPLPFSGHTDPEIRADAAAFFRSYLDGFEQSGRKSGEDGADFNELTKAQYAERDATGEALGLLLNKHLHPLATDKGKFKDTAESRREYRVIHDSLKAGMRDALK